MFITTFNTLPQRTDISQFGASLGDSRNLRQKGYPKLHPLQPFPSFSFQLESEMLHNEILNSEVLQ